MSSSNLYKGQSIRELYSETQRQAPS